MAAEQPSEGGADSGPTPLHFAAGQDDAAACRALLDAGAAIDAGDDRGATPLHWAAFFGRADAGIVLIDAGASSIRFIDSNGASRARAVSERMVPTCAATTTTPASMVDPRHCQTVNKKG